jgi:hypothetical protein
MPKLPARGAGIAPPNTHGCTDVCGTIRGRGEGCGHEARLPGRLASLPGLVQRCEVGSSPREPGDGRGLSRPPRRCRPQGVDDRPQACRHRLCPSAKGAGHPDGFGSDARGAPRDPAPYRRRAGAEGAGHGPRDRRHARARAHDWTTMGLYGLSRLAPWSDVSRLGAAWIVALTGHRVAGIDRDGILLISPNCARVRIYRVEPDECTVEAWALCRAACEGG